MGVGMRVLMRIVYYLVCREGLIDVVFHWFKVLVISHKYSTPIKKHI